MPKTVWWTGAEVMILRKHYASLGAKGVAPMLPNRSIFAITQAAQRLGIRRIRRYGHAPRAPRPNKWVEKARAHKPTFNFGRV